MQIFVLRIVKSSVTKEKLFVPNTQSAIVDQERNTVQKIPENPRKECVLGGRIIPRKMPHRRNWQGLEKRMPPSVILRMPNG